jgi:acetoin utilization deacetylase AcuC-like enzyme
MPSKTGFVYHERFLDHDTGAGHAERADRLRAVTARLKAGGAWQRLQHLLIDRAEEEQILAVHSPEHFRSVRDAVARGTRLLDDGDTYVSAESFDVALLAAGGVIAGVDAVMGGLLRNVFCAVRPPGHHAERERVMGFCLFNNIAVGARYAQSAYGVKRVAIVDWDVHHGNGTQEIFYRDKSVLFISLHQFPLWPGTGTREECGAGEGIERTVNIPLPPGSGEAEYLDAFRRDVLPNLDGFRPELIMISAGFDAHRDDPLANMRLTESSYAAMTDMLTEAADTYCQGRLVSVLEGGYNLEALGASVETHVNGLLSA